MRAGTWELILSTHFALSTLCVVGPRADRVDDSETDRRRREERYKERTGKSMIWRASA